MNKAYLIVTAMVFLLGNALAQKPGMKNMTPEEKAKLRTEHMLEKGIITEEQSDRAYEINLIQAKEMLELRESQRGQREKMRAERDAIRERAQADWGKLLSPEQQQRMQQMRKNRMERMKSKDGRMNGRHLHKMERKQEHKPRMDEK